jgi:hypothetical protein
MRITSEAPNIPVEKPFGGRYDAMLAVLDWVDRDTHERTQ